MPGPRARHAKAVRIGLALSAVIHLLLVASYPYLSRIGEERDPMAAVPVSDALRGGMEVVEIVVVDGVVDPERPSDPVELRALPGPALRPAAPDRGDPIGPGLVAPGPTVAERLRPSLEDSRLWAPLNRELADLTLEQRLNLDMAGRIVEWNDSVAAAEEARRRGTDWTTTDAQGRRWGVAEGQLHLGDVTLPLPFAFGTPVGRRDEVARRAWEWEEISRGAAGGEVRDSWRDRAQAIRERRDRERARVLADTTRSTR